MAEPTAEYNMNRRYGIRRLPAAIGTMVLKTGRNGAARTTRPPPRATSSSARSHRAGPMRRPSQLRRRGPERNRPTVNVSVHPASVPQTTASTTAVAPSGPRVATAASTATSAGIRTPSTGTESSTRMKPTNTLTSAVDSSPADPSNPSISLPSPCGAPRRRPFLNAMKSAGEGHPGFTPEPGPGISPTGRPNAAAVRFQLPPMILRIR
jgi:hypothetical protein